MRRTRRRRTRFSAAVWLERMDLRPFISGPPSIPVTPPPFPSLIVIKTRPLTKQNQPRAPLHEYDASGKRGDPRITVYMGHLRDDSTYSWEGHIYARFVGRELQLLQPQELRFARFSTELWSDGGALRVLRTL